MIEFMSETPEQPTDSIPAAAPAAAVPVAPAPAAAPSPEHKSRRLYAVAAWVAIVAGTVFIVAVIFCTGFSLGLHSGGKYHHGGGDGDRHGGMEFRGGPPPWMQMGPMMRPGQGFLIPGGPGGQGPGGQGPGGQGGQGFGGQGGQGFGGQSPSSIPSVQPGR
jgi:hypothetical protein